MGIIARHVGKLVGDPATRILTDINLEVRAGEFVALTGRSGSGKSTLLYVLSSLDQASEGEVEIDGRDVARMKEPELLRFRNEAMGFVFQFHYLIAEVTARENVLMPTRKARRQAELESRADDLLQRFGLADKGDRLPRQLSGGEQQRVAIARALVMKPRYLFADEPTGALDSVNGEIVLKILQDSHEQFGTTIIMVTHDEAFARRANRRIVMVDGKISEGQ